MPIFDQICLDCGARYELLVIGPERPFACPRCGSQSSERLPSVCSFGIRVPRFGSYRGDCSNPFENFTLHHVRDENGKKVKVNSLAELRAAEKKYNFSLAAVSEDGSNIDDAPQHEKWAGDIAHGYSWGWARDPGDRERAMASDVVKVDVGIAASKQETLAGRED